MAPSAPAGDGSLRSRSLRTPRRRLVLDRAARWVVSAGGLAIIVAILGILVFILVEVKPLLSRPEVKLARRLDVPGFRLGAVVVDEHRKQAVALAEDGRVVVVDVKGRKIVQTVDALTPGPSPSSPIGANSKVGEGLAPSRAGGGAGGENRTFRPHGRGQAPPLHSS